MTALGKTTPRDRLRIAAEPVITAAWTIPPTVYLLADTGTRNRTAAADLLGLGNWTALALVLVLLAGQALIMAGWLAGRHTRLILGSNLLATGLAAYAVMLVADRPVQTLLIATVLAGVATTLVRRASVLSKALGACL